MKQNKTLKKRTEKFPLSKSKTLDLNTQNKNSFSHYFAIASLFLLTTFLSFQTISGLDIGFHLKAGNWIIDNLRFPDNDPFTYTLSHKEYIDTYWLYQVVIALINRYSGELGIVLLNTTLIILTLYLTFYRIKLNGTPNKVLLYAVLFLAIIGSSINFEPRPHQFSWIYLSLVFIILERYYINRTRSLLWLPLIMLMWVNTHPLYILGWIVIFSFGLSIWWENKRTIDTYLLKYILASVIICFLNPYFDKGVFLPFKQFTFLQETSAFKQSISEYTSIFSAEAFKTYLVNGKLVLIQPIVLLHTFILLSLVIFVIKLKRQKPHNILLFASFFFILALAVKNAGYFVFAVLPLIVTQPVAKNIANKKDQRDTKNRFTNHITKILNKPSFETNSSIITIFISITMIFYVVTDAYYINYRSPERFGYKYNENNLPVKASQFLLDHKLEGRLLNHLNFGGYLMNLLPQKIFIDGRNELTDEQFFREYRNMNTNLGKKLVVDKYKPDIIIFPYSVAPSWVQYFGKSNDWRLVYYDEVAAIYLHKDYRTDISTVDEKLYLDSANLFDDRSLDSLIYSNKRRSFLSSFFKKQYYPQRELDLSVFCYYNNWLNAAIQLATLGLQKSTVDCPEAYFNLGTYFYQKKDYERAKYCYARFLQTNRNPIAETRLRAMQ